MFIHINRFINMYCNIWDNLYLVKGELIERTKKHVNIVIITNNVFRDKFIDDFYDCINEYTCYYNVDNLYIVNSKITKINMCKPLTSIYKLRNLKNMPIQWSNISTLLLKILKRDVLTIIVPFDPNDKLLERELAKGIYDQYQFVTKPISGFNMTNTQTTIINDVVIIYDPILYDTILSSKREGIEFVFGSADLLKCVAFIITYFNTIVKDIKIDQIGYFYNLYNRLKELIFPIINISYGEERYKVNILYQKLDNIVNDIINLSIDKIVDGVNNLKNIANLSKILPKVDKKYIKQLESLRISNLSLLNIMEQVPQSFYDFVKSFTITEAIDKLIISPITLTTWMDELNEYNCMGLMVDVYSSKLSQIGLKTNVDIINVSDTIYPVDDYFNKIVQANNVVNVVDINKVNIITDSIIKPNNGIIPLYINKYHWTISKRYLPLSLGLIISHNPLLYRDNYIKYIFVMLINMNRQLLDNINERFIISYFLYWRTCAQIAFDYNYNRGISNYLKRFYKSKKSVVQIESILGQCLCLNITYGKDKDTESIEELLMECLLVKAGEYIDKYVTDTYIKYIIAENIDINQEIDNIYDDIIHYSKYYMTNIYMFYRIHNIIDLLVSRANSYNQFIKLLDNNYGVLPIDMLNMFIKGLCKIDEIDISFDMYKDSIINIIKIKIDNYI